MCVCVCERERERVCVCVCAFVCVCLCMPTLASTYLLCAMILPPSLFQSVKKQFLDSLAGRLKQGAIRSRSITLKFVTAKSGSSALTATSDTLPVVTDASWESCKGKEREGSLQSFDVDVYWRNLGSSVMGHVVLYTEIIPTTMTVFEG